MEKTRQIVAVVLAGVTAVILLLDFADAILWGGHYDPPAGLFTLMVTLVGALFAPDVAKIIKGNGKNGSGKNGGLKDE